MATGDNWTKEETQNELKKRAEKALKKVKEQNKEKRFKTIKVCDKPLTYKEVEIKDE